MSISYENASSQFGCHFQLYSEIDSRDKSVNEAERENRQEKIDKLRELNPVFLDAISNTSRIDGAIIMSENLNLIGFGAKINVNKMPSKIILSSPINEKDDKNFGDWNVGTRHKSTVKFVSQNRNCLAVVFSEDKKMSLVYAENNSSDTVIVLQNFEWIAV